MNKKEKNKFYKVLLNPGDWLEFRKIHNGIAPNKSASQRLRELIKDELLTNNKTHV